LRIFAVAVRYLRPTCSGSPPALTRIGVITASPAIRRSALPLIGRGRARARYRPFGRPVSLARPPNRACASQRTRLSTSVSRWLVGERVCSVHGVGMR
jgi:hypothetical protein